MIKDLMKVYDYLEDNESKSIYLKRLNYILSGNIKYIMDIVDDYVKIESMQNWKLLIEILNKRKTLNINSKIVIYGAGGEGDALFSILNRYGINIDYFCDKNENLNGIKCLPVLNPNELFDLYKNDDISIVIGTEMYFDEIYQFLIANNINEDDVYGVKANFKEQYFIKDLVSINKNEIFVDCGSLDLKTSINFLELCPSGKVFAFEPDEYNYSVCKEVKYMNRLENVSIFKIGLGKEKKEVSFRSTQNGSSVACDHGNTTISINSLDNILHKEDITFIKMDIEGMELEALQGCKDIIINKKPKLAISIYHKNEDLVEIPMFIKNIVPEYKLFIRHHSVYPAETILYAIL